MTASGGMVWFGSQRPAPVVPSLRSPASATCSHPGASQRSHSAAVASLQEQRHHRPAVSGVWGRGLARWPTHEQIRNVDSVSVIAVPALRAWCEHHLGAGRLDPSLPPLRRVHRGSYEELRAAAPPASPPTRRSSPADEVASVAADGCVNPPRLTDSRPWRHRSSCVLTAEIGRPSLAAVCSTCQAMGGR